MNVRRDVETWLADTGLPHDIETGTNHLKVRLAGRMICVIPLKGRSSATNKRAHLNTRSQIRRAAKSIHAEMAVSGTIH